VKSIPINHPSTKVSRATSLRAVVRSTRSKAATENASRAQINFALPQNALWSRAPRDPFPVKYPCSLYYTDDFLLTTGISLFGTEQVFLLNSTFKPDFTNAGHQPYGRDQLAALYAKYRIRKCAIDIEFIDPSIDGILCAVQVQASTVATTLSGRTINQVCEDPLTFSSPISNSGVQKVVFRTVVDIASVEGITRTQFEGDSNYAALVGASPTNVPLLRIATASTSGATQPTLVARVKLTFIGEFYQRNLLGQS
jgi:hypothetical protein